MGQGSSSTHQDVQQNELVPEMGCEMEGHEWGSGHQWVVGCRDGGGECYGPAPGWLHWHEQGALLILPAVAVVIKISLLFYLQQSN